MRKIYVIGIGNKARSGKDQSATYIKEMRKNVYVLHFADALKEECTNVDRKYPLIREWADETGLFFALLDDAKLGRYKMVLQDTLPYLKKIFDERNITEYWGMDEKDSPILQFWGTDFRRNLSSDKYWVNQVNEKIQAIIDDTMNVNDDIFILVPDTRFKNEYEFIKTFRYGVFVRVERWTEDNSEQMLAQDRAKDHPSEIELDNVKEDYLIRASTLDELKQKNEHVLEYLEGIDE